MAVSAYEVFNVKKEYREKVAFPFKTFEQAEYVAHKYNGLVKIVKLHCDEVFRSYNGFFEIKMDKFYGNYYDACFAVVNESSDYFIDFTDFEY